MTVRVAVHRSWFVAFGVGVLFVALAFLHPLRAHAATLIVDTTNDTIVGGQCSLRGAITAVNTQTAQGNCIAGDGTNDTINFNISPNDGSVKTISVGSALPTLTKPVTINGYSQPLALANSSQNGDNAVILIELNGTNAGGTANGLMVGAGAGEP